MMDFFKSMFTKNYENLDGKAFKEIYEKEKSNAVLLDVRTKAEFQGGTIKGAKNIDLMSPTFSEQVDKLDKNKIYLLFCRSGNRSGQACNIMAGKGYKVYNLSGGVGAWPV
ncbi:rhodanese-like domain-containing protein [Cytophagales bacterium EPR-FJ-38]